MVFLLPCKSFILPIGGENNMKTGILFDIGWTLMRRKENGF